MAEATCSTEEFIALWNSCHSATTMAKTLGVSIQSVTARRRRIENSHGITLAVVDCRPKYDQSHMLVTDDRTEVKLTIDNGVVLVAGDQHYWPGESPTMHKAFVLLAKKLKPFACVWNGDAFDGSSISRHASIGWESKPTVRQELEAVNDRSAEIFKAAPSAKKIWNLGNHDMRFETRLASMVPEYKDMKGIHLKDHFPEWTPAWLVTINEGTLAHTEIRHREKSGVHASYNNTKESGVTLVTGHDHRADVVPYDDRRGRRYGVRHGMTAESSRDPQFASYLEGRKVNWQSAIAVLTYRNGELLQPELALRRADGVFEFRGEIYNV